MLEVGSWKWPDPKAPCQHGVLLIAKYHQEHLAFRRSLGTAPPPFEIISSHRLMCSSAAGGGKQLMHISVVLQDTNQTPTISYTCLLLAS